MSAFAADSALGGSGTQVGNAPEKCQAAELRNGFTIRYQRYEVVGSVTRLWTCAAQGAGYLDVPSEDIDHLEQEQNVAPSAPPPVASASPSEVTASAPPPTRAGIDEIISGAAARYQLDPDFVASVVRAESGFNPKAISPKGAQGLMQLMPQTATGLGVEKVLDPAANVDGGTKYLRQLLEQYNGDAVKALAAYNAGPGRVHQYGGIPPYRETWAYVTRIIEDYNRKKLHQQAEHRTTTPANK